MSGSIKLFTAEAINCYGVPVSDSIGLALNNLQQDLLEVFDKKVGISSAESADILVLTYSQMATHPELAEKLLVEELLDENGAVIWESYLMTLLEGKLYIVGGDERGTIFGIYDLSRRIGVSPWHFFGDVPVKHKKSWQLPADFRVLEWPSVKYRGIFINDEEELEHWAKLHTADGTIGPETYYHIFELLLRLKANYIWPAMHVNYFNENPENGALAQQMGVIVGTSHCDMLLRSNQNEWQPWLEAKGYQDKGIKYDYSIEGWNRARLQEYWRESVEMNQAYDVSYTVGMRGIHDTGFVTEAIDNDPRLSDQEKHQQKKALLEQVIADQRQLLAETLQREPQEIFQTFVPYKEVLQYYDDGLQIPEDVTIIWANDNYGYMRRYPNEQEQKRSGGHGLYYHSSYWSSNNMHYLFISSTPLARMKNELQKAWDNGIQKLWVLNVGALKAIEQDLEFYTRFAWEIGKEKTTSDIEAFLADWIDTEFSGSLGAEVGPLLNRFSQVTNVRKIEMMAENAFSQQVFGDEAGARLNELHQLYQRINQLAKRLPGEEKEAFFQLVQLKFHAAYFKNGEYYFADRSSLSYQQGAFPVADLYRQQSAEFTRYLRWLIHYFNEVMSEGKWSGILTPEVAPPPNMQMYPTTKPALQIGEPELLLQLWQGTTEAEQLSFSPEGSRTKWFQLANAGWGTIRGKLKAPLWLQLSQWNFIVSTEERILVSIDWAQVPPGTKEGWIEILPETGQALTLKVQLEAGIEEPVPGFVEADQAVVIPLASATYQQKQETAGWLVRPYLGRYQGAALEAYAPKMTSLPVNQWPDLPQVSYQFHLKTAGKHLAEFHRLPTLNSVGQIRFGVIIDDLPLQIVATETVDEHLGNWAEAVKNEVDKLYLELPELAAGEHRLRLVMIDSYVCLSKCVIYPAGFQKSSLAWREIPAALQHLPYFATAEYDSCKETYRCPLATVPLPDLIYADASFYQQDFINATILKLPQNNLGQATYFSRENGRKELVADYLADTIIEARGGQVAFEAELALADDRQSAYHTPAKPGAANGVWEHIGTPTADGTGLGMTILSPPGSLWPDPGMAPALHYRLRGVKAGTYKVWLLLKYDGREGAELTVGANGRILAPSERVIPQGLFHFLTTSLWHWNHFADVELVDGTNEFSIHGISGNIKIDRVFLTKEDPLPPVAADWQNTYL